MNEEKDPQDTADTKSSRMKLIVHFILQPKIAIPLIVVMLVIAAPLAYRSYRINQLPDIDHPFDLEAFLNFEVPDEENAYVEYQQAAKLLVPMKGTWDNKAHGEMEQHGWSKATPAFRDWLENNQPALKIWKKGTQKPNAQLIPYREMSLFSEDLDFNSHLRTLSQLMYFQTMKLRHEKKYTQAWEWNRAWFRFSRHVGQNGSFSERMIGNAMLSFMKDCLLKWIRSREVDEAMLRKALEEFETDDKLTPNIKQILKAEYVIYENMITSIESAEFSNSDIGMESMKSRLSFYFQGEPELSHRIIKHSYKNWLTQIAKPRYRQTKRNQGDIGLFELVTKKQKDEMISPKQLILVIWSSTLGSSFVQQNELMETAILRDRVNFDCLRIAIAAEIHKREHGSYPEKLEELKDTLGEIPDDPFYSKSKRNLQYRKENGGYVVWSVGDDEIDEHGTINTEWPDKMIWDDVGLRVGNNKSKKKQSKKK